MESTDRAVAPIPRRRLWLGLYLAPSAWALAFAFNYVLVARYCEGDNGMHWRGLPGTRWVDFGVAVVMTCVAAVGLSVALGSLHAANEPPAESDLQLEIAAGAVDAEPRSRAPWWGREQFMARAGVIGSAIFLGGTLLLVYPPLVLNLCSQAR